MLPAFAAVHVALPLWLFDSWKCRSGDDILQVKGRWGHLLHDAACAHRCLLKNFLDLVENYLDTAGQPPASRLSASLGLILLEVEGHRQRAAKSLVKTLG